ncbi:MAG: methyltransferase domain-containing protein [Candidatus Tectomicrobia bacterium]|nr:methyltransferase domain-containing protein [Candidatus Tectomicrobia bacterium]
MAAPHPAQLQPSADRFWQHHWNDPRVVSYLEERFDLSKRTGVNVAKVELLGQVVREGETFLDVGCGPGRFFELTRPFGVKYTGVDVTPNMVARARRRYPDADFRVDDAFRLSFEDGSFDVVFNNDVLRHVPQPAAIVSELARVARRQVVIMDFIHPTHETFLWYGPVVKEAEGFSLTYVRNRAEFEAILSSAGLVPTTVVELATEEQGTHHAYLFDKALDRCRKGNEDFARAELAAARRAYEEALRIDPACAEALYNLGMADLNEGRWDCAADHLSRAAALRPEDGDFLKSLAVAELQHGRREAALATIERYLALAPGDEKAIAFRDNLRHP